VNGKSVAKIREAESPTHTPSQTRFEEEKNGDRPRTLTVIADSNKGNMKIHATTNKVLSKDVVAGRCAEYPREGGPYVQCFNLYRTRVYETVSVPAQLHKVKTATLIIFTFSSTNEPTKT
jgi:hypothetical protein